MKSMIPDPDRLDELAAGLDAGWDDEPVASGSSIPPLEPSASQPPHSSPLPKALEALDAAWDVPAAEANASRAQQQRASQTRPSQARPSPTRAITLPTPVGAAPVRATKQERRDAERKRRAHEAQQRSANKLSRKAERVAEARRQSEQLRAAEQHRRAERATRPPKARTQPAPRAAAQPDSPARVKEGKRRARRDDSQTAVASPALGRAPAARERQVPASKEAARPVALESGPKKLIIPLLLALLFALTFYFALSRAR
jgi:hypothetical protein